MKRILRYTLMLLSAGLIFTACSDKEEVTPAPMPTGAQVFFGNELPTAYEINPEENSINVVLSRAEAGGALTVPITAKAETTKYTIPESVTFAAGETTANLPISYVPAEIVYGEYETITLTIGDKNQSTPYGYSTYSFKIGVTDWTDWGPWNSAGTATYYYSLYWSGAVDSDLPFVYRQNVIKPNLYQFKISKWGYGVDLVLDWDKETGYVSCARQYTGYDHSTYGPLYVTDYTTYRIFRGLVPGVDFDIEYGTFDEEEGIIEIPMDYNVEAGHFGYDYEYIYIGGYNRADVSCDVAYAGKFFSADEKTFVVANVTLGADVTSAVVALVEGSVTEEIQAAILAGEYENMIEVFESGEVKFPADDLTDGNYTFVVISYLDGEARNADSATFKYEVSASAWKSLGMATYTEDCLGPLYCGEEEDPLDYVQTYEVEIQENQQQPGLYRLKNPYGEAYPFNRDGTWDASRDYYMEINAVDPDGVFITPQVMGVDFGEGVFIINSLAAYQMDRGNSFEAVKAAGICGKLENGVITFPVKGLLCALGEDGWYYGNTTGSFKVVLPGASEGVKVDGAAKQVRKHVKSEKAQIEPMLQNGYKSAALHKIIK